MVSKPKGPNKVQRSSNGTQPVVWAIGGGKGGVGKSVVAANLSVRVAQLGRKVVVVDGDLGGANLDALLGCERPPNTLAHFFSRKVATLVELAVPTSVEHLSLVAGDAETLGSANPAHAQKLKLIRHLRTLPCDVVIVDLGAGTSFNTLDMFGSADVGLVVTTPEPTAVQNCFGFIKAAAMRSLERSTGVQRREIGRASGRRYAATDSQARTIMSKPAQLIVNRAQASEARKVTNLLHDLAGRFLGSTVRLAGVVRDDPAVQNSVRRMVPLCAAFPSSMAAHDLGLLARGLLEPPQTKPKAHRQHGGVNEELMHAGMRVHMQTEDLGADQAAIRTQIFLPNGSVIYSRRTPYVDDFFRKLGVEAADRVRFHHVAVRRALLQGRIELERRSA